MSRYYPRLRTRIMFIVIIATIPALGLIFYNDLRYRQHQEIETRENALRLARLAAGNIEKSVEGTRQVLISLSRTPVVRGGSRSACGALLKDLLNHYQNYALFGVADLRGDVTCNAFPFRGVVNIADRPYFQRALKTQDFSAGEYQVGRISGKATINFAYPVSEESGKMKAVVYSAMDLEWLNTLASKIHLPEGGAIIVTDRNGRVLTHHPEPEEWVGKNMRESPLVQSILTHESEGVTEVPGVDGVQRIFGFTPLHASDTGIYVGIGISKEAVSAEANRALVVNLLALGGIVVLSLAAAGFFSTAFIMRPVNALVAAAKRIAAGDFSVRTGLVHRQDELGQLAQAFDNMAESIDRHLAERKRAEEERERLILDHLEALAEVNTLSGLLPICSSCKKIRDDEGYWQQIEDYISKHSEAEFSHGLCPECMKKMYPEYRKVDRQRGAARDP